MGKIIKSKLRKKTYIKKNKYNRKNKKYKTQKRINLKRKTQKRKTQKRKNMKRKTLRRKNLKSKKKVMRGGLPPIFLILLGLTLPQISQIFRPFLLRVVFPTLCKLGSCLLYHASWYLGGAMELFVDEESSYKLCDMFNNWKGVERLVVQFIRGMLTGYLHFNALDIIKMIVLRVEYYVLSKLLDCYAKAYDKDQDDKEVHADEIFKCVLNPEFTLPKNLMEMSEFTKSLVDGPKDELISSLEEKARDMFGVEADVIILAIRVLASGGRYKRLIVDILQNKIIDFIDNIFTETCRTDPRSKNMLDNIALHTLYDEYYCSIRTYGGEQISLSAVKEIINDQVEEGGGDQVVFKLKKLTENKNLIHTGWLTKLSADNKIIGDPIPIGGVLALNYREGAEDSWTSEQTGDNSDLYKFLEIFGRNPSHIRDVKGTLLWENNFNNDIRHVAHSMVEYEKAINEDQLEEDDEEDEEDEPQGLNSAFPVENLEPPSFIIMGRIQGKEWHDPGVTYYIIDMTVFGKTVALKLRYSVIKKLSEDINEILKKYTIPGQATQRLPEPLQKYWAKEKHGSKITNINHYLSEIVRWCSRGGKYMLTLFAIFGIRRLLEYVADNEYQVNSEGICYVVREFNYSKDVGTILDSIYTIEMKNYNDNLTGRTPYSADIDGLFSMGRHWDPRGQYGDDIYCIQGWLPLKHQRMGIYKEHYSHIIKKLCNINLYNQFIIFLNKQFHCHGNVEQMFWEKYGPLDFELAEIDNWNLDSLHTIAVSYVTKKPNGGHLPSGSDEADRLKMEAKRLKMEAERLRGQAGEEEEMSKRGLVDLILSKLPSKIALNGRLRHKWKREDGVEFYWGSSGSEDPGVFILLYVRLLSLLKIFVMYYVTFGIREKRDLEYLIEKEYKIEYMIPLCLKHIENDYNNTSDTMVRYGWLGRHDGYNLFDKINMNAENDNYLLKPIWSIEELEGMTKDELKKKAKDLKVYSKGDKRQVRKMKILQAVSDSVVNDIHLYSTTNDADRSKSSVKLKDLNRPGENLNIDLSYINLDMLQNMLLGDDGEFSDILNP